MATLNIGIKVSRAIGGGAVIAAGAMGIVTYGVSAGDDGDVNFAGAQGAIQSIVTRYFGPGSIIPASFTAKGVVRYGPGAAPYSAFFTLFTYTVLSGVELINTQ